MTDQQPTPPTLCACGEPASPYLGRFCQACWNVEVIARTKALREKYPQIRPPNRRLEWRH